LHTFIGLLLIVLTTINLLRIDWSYMMGTVFGSGIWCGAIFAVTGFMAIFTAHRRRTDISKSKIQVKIFFALSVVTLLLTTTYFILLIFDLKEKTFNHYIESNIIMAFIFELFTSLLSLFTCVRIIWPGSLAFCAKDWPMHQKLKRKIIVSTQIYTNGVKQNEDMIRNLGPNCVISLGSPPSDAITRNDNYSEKIHCNQCVTICEFCEPNLDFQPNICHHNLRHHCLNNEDIDEQYDSEFDVDNFDSDVISSQVCESHESEPQINHTYEVHPNDCTQESENKYETIGGNKTSDESIECLNSSETNDKSEEEEDNQNKDTTTSSETNDSPKTSCEISQESVSEV